MCENRVQRSVLPGVKTDIAMSLKASYLFILLVYLSTYLVEGSFTICNLFFGFTVICSPIPEMAALTVHSFMFLNAPNWLIWFPKKSRHHSQAEISNARQYYSQLYFAGSYNI